LNCGEDIGKGMGDSRDERRVIMQPVGEADGRSVSHSAGRGSSVSKTAEHANAGNRNSRLTDLI